MKLYITCKTASSHKTLKKLRNILNRELKDTYRLKVINILKEPTSIKKREQILAIPTLMRILHPPVREVIKELYDKDKILSGLDLIVER